MESVRYAKSRDGARIAWIESGGGPKTLILAPVQITDIVEDWINPLSSDPLKAFSEHFRVVRFDNRGFGHSSRDVAHGMDLWADDIEAVADASGCGEPFVLLGQSWAFGSLAFAARAPERLSHLLIYGSKANGDLVSGDPALASVAQARIEFMRAAWARNDPGVKAMFPAFLAKDMTAEEQRFFAERNLTDVALVQDKIGHDQAAAEADTRPFLGSIRTPTLVGHARGDQASPFNKGQELARAIAGAEFVVIEGENHALRERDGSLKAWVSHVLSFVYGAAKFSPLLGSLSRREQDVLDGVCAGLTNDAIATRLGISEKTVRNHLTQVFDKLGVATRTQAALFANSTKFEH